ncbi:MAG: O-antigen ligase family protein [Synergistaceae bacterium]|jgi:O-antigen ligase|nr:O-antigen ligase family protein [Synergistaceae bacterium]
MAASRPADKKIKERDVPSEAFAAAPRPLVPFFIIAPLWFISLGLPNLVYSGVYWYDTLHLIKWFVAGVPVAVALIVAGARLFFYGRKGLDFRVDLFGAIWLGLLAYTMMQSLWVPIYSKVSFLQEFLCFAAVWAFYVLSWNSFPNRTIRPLLWLANLNAALNVVFAELQIRNLNGFTRLILPTPGNYIGNTGQQNMFGLWMAVCVMSSIYLYIAYATTPEGKKRHVAVTVANLLLMAVNFWGLWNSTSRSAILSLTVALVVLAFIILRQFGRDYAKRLGHVIVVLALVAFFAVACNYARAVELVSKTVDMVQNVESFGGRDGIWATSRTMFKMQPWKGVGIGQYKWHYLEAQREMFKTHPDKLWQYTHWAHNEFLQWFCEGGVVGGSLLTAMWGLWGISLLVMLRRREHVAPEVIWACALIALISFNAFWTRPFHRIENILWLSLAFSLFNRDMVARLMPGKVFSLGNMTRICGCVMLAASLGGLYYLGDGMVGDRTIRRALNTQNAAAQRTLLEKASEHFMVQNDALKNLGYHYIQLGEQTQNLETLSSGFQLLWQHFLREPHSEELRVLLDWSQRFQSVAVLETLASYLKPGTYRLGVQHDAVDSRGNVVSAVVLVPLQSSGGMRIVDNISDEGITPYDESEK